MLETLDEEEKMTQTNMLGGFFLHATIETCTLQMQICKIQKGVISWILDLLL